MEDLGKIAGFNIAFILFYAVALRMLTSHSNVMEASMLLVIMQTLFNFIMSIVHYGNRETRKANSYLLTTFLVLIIGFGVCVMR